MGISNGGLREKEALADDKERALRYLLRVNVGTTAIRRMNGAMCLDTAVGSSLFHDRDKSGIFPTFRHAIQHRKRAAIDSTLRSAQGGTPNVLTALQCSSVTPDLAQKTKQ